MQQEKNWNIVDYCSDFKDGVIDLILTIQNIEAGLDIPIEQQPDLLTIETNYMQAGGGFWVALDESGHVVGSVGLQRETESVSVLKKFFVKERYRGTGVAAELFGALLRFADRNKVKTILLDTPAVATRSHRFYIRNGFRQIDKSQAPISYDYPDRDSLLFRLDR